MFYIQNTFCTLFCCCFFVYFLFIYCKLNYFQSTFSRNKISRGKYHTKWLKIPCLQYSFSIVKWALDKPVSKSWHSPEVEGKVIYKGTESQKSGWGEQNRNSNFLSNLKTREKVKIKVVKKQKCQCRCTASRLCLSVSLLKWSDSNCVCLNITHRFIKSIKSVKCFFPHDPSRGT